MLVWALCPTVLKMFGYFSFSPVQLFDYMDRNPLWKNWRNHFQVTLSWCHGILFPGDITYPSVNASRSENGHWTRDCEFLLGYPPSACWSSILNLFSSYSWALLLQAAHLSWRLEYSVLLSISMVLYRSASSVTTLTLQFITTIAFTFPFC